MKAKLSNGYGSEFVVIERATGAPVSNVVLMFPMSDKQAFMVLRKYLDSNREVYTELESLYERCQREWKHIGGE